MYASTSFKSGQTNNQTGTVPFVNQGTLKRGFYDSVLVSKNVVLNVPVTFTITFETYTSLVLTQGVYFGQPLATIINDHCTSNVIPCVVSFSTNTNRYTFLCTANVHMSSDNDTIMNRLFGATHFYFLNGVSLETNQLDFERTKHYKLVLHQLNQFVLFHTEAAFQETFATKSLNTINVPLPLFNLNYSFVGDDDKPLEMAEWDLIFTKSA